MMEEERQQKGLVLRALEALKKACRDLQDLSPDAAANEDRRCNSPSMNALLELHSDSEDLFYGDPHLSTLAHLLSRLKSLASEACSRSGAGAGAGGLFSLVPLPLLRRRRGRGRSCEISLLAGSIESEIQSWIDRESVDRLVAALRAGPSAAVDEKITLLLTLEDCLSRGFDRDLQEVLLRSGTFQAIESVLADTKAPMPVREQCAHSLAAMVRFNKAVFVGPVLMGPVVRSLVAMGTAAAIRVLRGLVTSIRSPLIDELNTHDEIPRIVGFLGSDEPETKVSGLELVMELGYFGRKEAVEAVMQAGAIKLLVGLQASELGGTLMETAGSVGDGGDKRFVERHPFASCVARFAIQVEVGEGLRQREKRALKQEILARMREAVSSEAEAATILAEVLWGSTP